MFCKALESGKIVLRHTISSGSWKQLKFVSSTISCCFLGTIVLACPSQTTSFVRICRKCLCRDYMLWDMVLHEWWGMWRICGWSARCCIVDFKVISNQVFSTVLEQCYSLSGFQILEMSKGTSFSMPEFHAAPFQEEYKMWGENC